MAEKILRTEYSEEMQRSYMNYSMSVITARAIPDARDGLKPVPVSYTHLGPPMRRRIIFIKIEVILPAILFKKLGLPQSTMRLMSAV